jgi:hypothetical protein
MDRRDRDVKCVARFGGRHRLFPDQRVRQVINLNGGFQEIKVFDDRKALRRSRRVALRSFVEDNLRDEQFIVRRLIPPPIASQLLPGGDERIRVNSSRDVTDDRCFQVDGVHRGIVSDAPTYEFMPLYRARRQRRL